jgi:hypothetical protein
VTQIGICEDAPRAAVWLASRSKRGCHLDRGPYGWMVQPATRLARPGTASNMPSTQFALPVLPSSA